MANLFFFIRKMKNENLIKQSKFFIFILLIISLNPSTTEKKLLNFVTEQKNKYTVFVYDEQYKLIITVFLHNNILTNFRIIMMMMMM